MTVYARGRAFRLRSPAHSSRAPAITANQMRAVSSCRRLRAVAGARDRGHMIEDHGGMLDRLDGAIFAA
jgi:hypothetical protein